jgi:dihydroorotate dehydrogenase electron transfer subunit
LLINGYVVKQIKAEIISNSRLSRDLYKIEFAYGENGVDARPGQFFTLRITDSTVPFLRRPFAFSCFDPAAGVAGAIYQRRGKGTEILSGMKPGEVLDVIAPLGNAFPMPGAATTCICVAGGIGLGPILFLADTLRHGGRDVKCIAGFRTTDDVPRGSGLEEAGAVICTDDGSEGFHGTAVDGLERMERETGGLFRAAVCFACGPKAMLKGCHEFCGPRAVECYVSVEQVMACGIGACMGCAVKASGNRGFVRVCCDGPVFDSRELAWT